MKSPSTKRPLSSMKKQRSPSPSQAMPRSAPVSSTLSMMNSRFSGSSGLGSWSGKLPSGVQYVSMTSIGRRSKQRADHRPGHAVAAVDDDLHRPDVRRVDDAQRRLLEGVVDVDLLDGAAAGWVRFAVEAVARARARACSPMPLSPAERDRALLDELRAGVGLRVVRGGAHQAAVELARADEPVEHLGADLPRVDDRRALADHAVAVARRQLGRAEAHVAPKADAAVRGRLALEIADHAREAAADPLGGVAVDLLAVDARAGRRP